MSSRANPPRTLRARIQIEININSFTFGRENKNDDDDNKNPDDIQSGRSSPAKHGDAYFSAIYGFMKDPIAAPGLYEN